LRAGWLNGRPMMLTEQTAPSSLTVSCSYTRRRSVARAPDEAHPGPSTISAHKAVRAKLWLDKRMKDIYRLPGVSRTISGEPAKVTVKQMQKKGKSSGSTLARRADGA